MNSDKIQEKQQLLQALELENAYLDGLRESFQSVQRSTEDLVGHFQRLYEAQQDCNRVERIWQDLFQSIDLINQAKAEAQEQGEDKTVKLVRIPTTMKR